MDKDLRGRLDILQGDITKMEVDAIVNAANTSLLGGGGVDGAIHRAAGPELLKACRAIGGCPTGAARITRGYYLPAKYIIHTVGPIYSGKPDDARLLADCYHNSLTLALENGVRTLAFPAISCGVYGYPVSDACKIAVKSCADALRDHSAIEKVTFVLFNDADYAVYKQYISNF